MRLAQAEREITDLRAAQAANQVYAASMRQASPNKLFTVTESPSLRIEAAFDDST